MQPAEAMARMKQEPRKSTSVKVPREPAADRTKRSTAMRQYAEFIESAGLSIPRSEFLRLMRDVVNDYKPGVRFHGTAVGLIQVACESHIVELFRDANAYATRDDRETVKVKDMQLALAARKSISNAAPQ
ncbi:hypothetical protein SDRG_10508 [Saprolegnia diclina VS20]|uniref:Core Histone H2A/H2B/H3 domain-containing protein n=1 Tax=Saprolegnia diclina (strain VS20) TaxID=1156394 RepID=T0QDQ1_SAPDV|nr:hypothetical protein SDRG_10508 [Saprolegnia diclina VS20]EQC31715.1 hypothetical protein SDRG_10508 [Saprolegnia diclina VS20]|eukprot:XP_008614722.1 hypothetical protein SDRG_10508 [Saprolegnia diclina VS20]